MAADIPGLTSPSAEPDAAASYLALFTSRRTPGRQNVDQVAEAPRVLLLYVCDGCGLVLPVSDDCRLEDVWQ